MCAIKCIVWFLNQILFLENHVLQWNWYSEFIIEYTISIKYLFNVLRCQVNCTYKLNTQYFKYSIRSFGVRKQKWEVKDQNYKNGEYFNRKKVLTNNGYINVYDN